MTESFTKWLLERIKEDSATGDLARDAAQDPDFPEYGGLSHYLEHLESNGACDNAIAALAQAWAKWWYSRPKSGGGLPSFFEPDEAA